MYCQYIFQYNADEGNITGMNTVKGGSATYALPWRHHARWRLKSPTSLTTVYSTVYSCADQRRHKNSVSLAFVRGIHRRPVNSPHTKGPVTRKIFPFNDVIMFTYASDPPNIRLYHRIMRWGWKTKINETETKQQTSNNTNAHDLQNAKGEITCLVMMNLFSYRKYTKMNTPISGPHMPDANNPMFCSQCGLVTQQSYKAMLLPLIYDISRVAFTARSCSAVYIDC